MSVGYQPAEAKQNWVRGVSVPAAILGLLAFFLPWFQVSCGPMHLEFSGYELATGQWEKKVGAAGGGDFVKGLGSAQAQMERRSRLGKRRESPGSDRQQSNADQMLWLVPAACAVLLVLAIFGLPKIPSISAALVGGAYLAYFGISLQDQATNPQNTAGLLQTNWLLGYWACWVGLVVPFVVALIKPSNPDDFP